MTTYASLADESLAAVVAYAAAKGVTLPDRQGVVFGATPAWDCESLVVCHERSDLGLPGIPNTAPLTRNDPSLTAVTLAVWLIRCVPTMDDTGATSIVDLDTSAHEMLTDAQLLFDAILQAWYAKTLGSGCDTIAVTGVEPIGPDGGFGAYVMRYQAQVD